MGQDIKLQDLDKKGDTETDIDQILNQIEVKDIYFQS